MATRYWLLANGQRRSGTEFHVSDNNLAPRGIILSYIVATSQQPIANSQ